MSFLRNVILKTAVQVIRARVSIDRQFAARTFDIFRTPRRRRCRDEDGWDGPPIRIAERLDAIAMAHAKYIRADEVGNIGLPPVLILHELLGNKSDWHYIATAITVITKRMVISADLRNHGSSPHTHRCTYDYIVEDIHLLLQKLNASKFVLLGHGMGGRAAMMFAHIYPDLVEKLIIVDIAPMGFAPCYFQIPRVLDIMQNITKDGRLSLPQARLLQSKHLIHFVPNHDVGSFLRDNIFKDENERYVWRMNLEAIVRDFDHIATFPKLRSTSSTPAYFIAGGNSGCVYPTHKKRIRRFFKNAKLKFIEGADHYVHIQRRVEFLTCVVDVLSLRRK